MVNTINPADCDRVTVYTGECRNFQDTEWITFNSGRRRSPNARDGNTWLIDVAHGSFWMTDDQVRNLVRLVPARPITRQDLPSLGQIISRHQRAVAEFPIDTDGMNAVLDAVVERLNANGGVPQSPDSTYGIPREDYAYVDWPATCAAERAAADRAEADADRWRRAHEIVEGERDQAREQWKKWEHKADEWKQEHDLLVVHGSVRGDTYAAMARERDEWKARAEAAEARTAPAVTKAEVGKVVREALVLHGVAPERVTDAVWSLVSGADPAVHVVRESDVAAVKVTEAGQFWRAGDTSVPLPWKANKVREKRDECAAEWAELEAIARAIEAGQAADQVEELAGQIESATRKAIRQVCDGLADVVPSLDPLTVERAMEVTAASRKVAAHVLGQEAGDE